jgi:uncharacterized protein YbaP (TraB family)
MLFISPFNRSLALSLALLLMATISQAETSIWKVSSNDNTVYIGGTFHMLKPSDYPLPIEFEDVYKKVDWLVFETDIIELGTPSFNKKFINAMKLPSGQILADKLSSEAYAQLIYYAAKNNIDTADFQYFKPQMIALIISLRELKKLGLTAQGVDNFFGNKAIKDKKVLSELETLDEQIDYIANISKGNESALILQTIEDFKNLPEELNQLTKAWRSGNEQQLEDLGIRPIKKDYPQIYHSLIVERNNNWLPKIEQLIKQPEEKFILVGAMHLIGEDGLLKRLKNRGYRVSRY